MIMKVKEPIEVEWPHMKRGQLIFTYFHFAADEALTSAHIDSGATCVAYETVELPSRELPLLTPMSEVAGRMAVQEGAKYLGEAVRRPRRAARRRAGRGAGQGRDPRRRHRRHQRGEDGGGHGRQGHDPRPVARAAALPVRRHAGQRDDLLEPPQHPRADHDGRPRGGRRADSGRQGARSSSAAKTSS